MLASTKKEENMSLENSTFPTTIQQHIPRGHQHSINRATFATANLRRRFCNFLFRERTRLSESDIFISGLDIFRPSLEITKISGKFPGEESLGRLIFAGLETLLSSGMISTEEDDFSQIPILVFLNLLVLFNTDETVGFVIDTLFLDCLTEK